MASVVKFGVLACGLSLAMQPTVVQAAMNWCGIPSITPRDERDFDRIAPIIEGLTNCKRQPNDSVHESKWICPDDPANDTLDLVHINLSRIPGEGVQLVVISSDLNSLDVIRKCQNADVKDDKKFDSGNVTLRDRLSVGFAGPTISLFNSGRHSASTIVANTAYSRDQWIDSFLIGAFGVKRIPYPTTSVKLAGESPISSSASALVQAFISRGSAILSSEELDGTYPSWKLSAPTGLGGVKQVEVQGFISHLLKATYVMDDLPAYERFVALLDEAYEPSQRKVEGSCTIRHWSSGQVHIRGKYCPEQGSIVEFFNMVAVEQHGQIFENSHADAAKNGEVKKLPKIDRDNF